MVKPTIAIRYILFATDFEAPANRALPFAVALTDHYRAKLYVVHVIPEQAYVFAQPESFERILKETRDFSGHTLRQLAHSLTRDDRRCEALLDNGDIVEVMTKLAQLHAADLIVVGTSSRKGLDKLLVGSVAEEILRTAPCPVLAVGAHVSTQASAGIQSIVCAVDFSLPSLRATELAISLAKGYEAHLTLIHVVDGVLRKSPSIGVPFSDNRLRQLIPQEGELKYKPEVLTVVGPVADCLLTAANDLSADILVMGVRGMGALAQTASHFGSIAHRVVSFAKCPVLTIGESTKLIRSKNELASRTESLLQPNALGRKDHRDAA
jgi:nucleotide-binding universal stress UspA family protein